MKKNIELIEYHPRKKYCRIEIDLWKTKYNLNINGQKELEILFAETIGKHFELLSGTKNKPPVWWSIGVTHSFCDYISNELGLLLLPKIKKIIDDEKNLEEVSICEKN